MVSTFAANANWGEADITITVSDAPLEIYIEGGNRLIGTTTDFMLSATKSIDPEDPTLSTADWDWNWYCEDWTDFGTTNSLYGYGVDETQLTDEYIEEYKSFVPPGCLTTAGANLMLSIATTGNDELYIPAGAVPADKLYYFIAMGSIGTRNGKGYVWVEA